MLETFYDLNEVREAIRAALGQAAGADMVIVAHVTIDDDGTMRGAPVEKYTRVLDELPCDVIGLNCSVGPKAMLDAVEQMSKLTAKPLSVMPNAGMPATVEGRKIYLCSPEYMSQYARRFLLAGVKIVGGCCGTTPSISRKSAAKSGRCSRCTPPPRS